MEPIRVFGEHEERVVDQLRRCVEQEDGSRGVLCADGHLGYSAPIGGVVAYREHVSPAAVGYDIGCGNLAARTDLAADDEFRAALPGLMDRIYSEISFGLGRRDGKAADHPVIDRIREAEFEPQRALAETAAAQLGTVGAGNHYVDLFADEEGRVWIGVHFGSRGFGHKTASGFLALAKGRAFGDRVPEGQMEAPPDVVHVNSELGAAYLAAMRLAGEYAYAGREVVVDQVAGILGAAIVDSVHNHHNYAWEEEHAGEHFHVLRKGATPAFPGQRGFVGATMGEPAVILEGVESEASQEALRSTVHGAGRAMSRRQARGRKGRPGAIDWQAARADLARRGIELRGANAEEAPGAYKRLDEVLAHHAGTVRILHTLEPLGVAMAPGDVRDPYKD